MLPYQEAEEAKLQHQRQLVADAERQARKRAAVAQYRTEKALDSARHHAVDKVLGTGGAGLSAEDVRQRDERVALQLEAASQRSRSMQARAAVPNRSERLLVEASEHLRQLRLGLVVRGDGDSSSGGIVAADPARLASQDTAASKARVASTIQATRGVHERRSGPAHGCEIRLCVSSACFCSFWRAFSEGVWLDD